MENSPEILINSNDIVGESVVWDERNGCCYWVDLIGRKVQSFEFSSRQHRIWDIARPTPEILKNTRQNPLSRLETQYRALRLGCFILKCPTFMSLIANLAKRF